MWVWSGSGLGSESGKGSGSGYVSVTGVENRLLVIFTLVRDSVRASIKVVRSSRTIQKGTSQMRVNVSIRVSVQDMFNPLIPKAH